MNNIRQKGFTLVELVVAMGISAVIAAAIIGFFISQQKSHTAQEQVTFMQQNLRAGLGVMTRELRMAGYQVANGTSTFLTGNDPDNAGLQLLGLNRVKFRFDLDGDGVTAGEDPAEEIDYRLVGTDLTRNGEVMAENIEAVAFAFGYDSDGDDVMDNDGASPPNTYFAIAGPVASGGVGPLDGSVNWYWVNNDGTTTDSGVPARFADIRAVKIWLLGRTGAADPNFTNTETFYVGPQTVAPGDNDNLHHRHRLLETVVRCRNLGLGS